MRHLPILLFDFLFVFFGVVVYGSAASIAVAAASPIWDEALWRRGLAIVVGYFVFLHAFVLVVGIVKRIVQRPLHVGMCDVGLNAKYVNWGLNSIFQGLFTTSFFDRQVHILFYLRFFYYRMMGMKLPLNCVIGTRAIIRQAELIELGSKVVLGEMSGLYGHMSPDGKKHFQGRIRIGDHSLIGGYSTVGPDVEIGDRTMVGAHTTIAPGARVGSDVHMGPLCYVGRGVRIPDGVRLLGGTWVAKSEAMKSGETWAGNPAVKVETREP